MEIGSGPSARVTSSSSTNSKCEVPTVADTVMNGTKNRSSVDNKKKDGEKRVERTAFKFPIPKNSVHLQPTKTDLLNKSQTELCHVVSLSIFKAAQVEGHDLHKDGFKAEAFYYDKRSVLVRTNSAWDQEFILASETLKDMLSAPGKPCLRDSPLKITIAKKQQRKSPKVREIPPKHPKVIQSLQRPSIQHHDTRRRLDLDEEPIERTVFAEFSPRSHQLPMSPLQPNNFATNRGINTAVEQFQIMSTLFSIGNTLGGLAQELNNIQRHQIEFAEEIAIMCSDLQNKRLNQPGFQHK